MACCISFCWYWFPDFIFPALSYFSFPCWIKPESKVVNQIFGMSSGMGLLPITFDCEYPGFAGRSKDALTKDQGVKYPMSALHCLFLRGQFSTYLFLWCFGFGLWPLLVTIPMSGIRDISPSRVPKVHIPTRVLVG